MTGEIEQGRLGSTFDSFLQEQGIAEELREIAAKQVIAWQLAEGDAQAERSGCHAQILWADRQPLVDSNLTASGNSGAAPECQDTPSRGSKKGAENRPPEPAA